MPSDQRGTNGDTRAAAADDGPTITRRKVLAVAGTAAVGSSLAAHPGSATVGTESIARQEDPASDGDVLRDGVWVETDVDTDENDVPDRIYVEIARAESQRESEPLPVILHASPYFGEQTHSDTTPEMLFDRNRPLGGSTNDDSADSAAGGGAGSQDGHSARTSDSPAQESGASGDWIGPTWVEQRFITNGYVIAYAASVGIGESTGCYTAAGPETAEGLRSVVDWFNGRADAYDAPSGGASVEATWTDGSTGMIGASGDGELANAVATTGVDGLEAIVPISANNGQYSLFRANGTPISATRDTGDRIADLSSWVAAGTAERADCSHWVERVETGQDRATGDYNDFWHEREFLTDADAVDCGVLLAHGLDDAIVKPNHAADWYEELVAADVPVRLWLHGGGHVSPRGERWRELLDRWWAYWLDGEDNGVMDEDPVTVVHGSNSPRWGPVDTHETWPVPDSELTTMQFAPDGTETGELRPEPSAGSGDPAAGSDASSADGSVSSDDSEVSFVDDPSTPAGQLARADSSEHRLRYQTPPLAESVQVSGNVVPSLSLRFEEPTVVSAALVEYGSRDYTGIVARGWADPRNRPSYGEHDSPVAYKESLRESESIEAGEQVHVEFPLQATDHVFSQGSRIGLVVYASDREFTLHPPDEPEVTVALGESSVSLPVVGGEDALAEAFEADVDGGSDGGSGDDGLPGFGVGSALAALGGAGYALRRRLGTARRSE